MDCYCGGFTAINLSYCKREHYARFMTDSSYLAHTTPLLIKHGLLNVRTMFKLKLLKFYYKLSYNLLPPYFNNYIDIIEQKPARDLRFTFSVHPRSVS